MDLFLREKDDVWAAVVVVNISQLQASQ